MEQGLYITHKKEQFSIAFIQAIATYAGCNIGRYAVDNDSIDIMLSKKDIYGRLLDSADLNIQLKCTELDFSDDGNIHFNLPIKNYIDLRKRSASPRILVVLNIPKNIDCWLMQTNNLLILRRCAYWISLRDLNDSNNINSVTVLIPKINMFTPDTLCNIMEKIADGESI